jgi:hypothetical protein
LGLMGNQESALGTCLARDEASWCGAPRKGTLGKGTGRSGRHFPTMGIPAAASVSPDHDVAEDCIEHANGLGVKIQRLQIQIAEIKKRKEEMALAENCKLQQYGAMQHDLVSCQTELRALILEKETYMHRLQRQASLSVRHVRTVHAHAGQFAGHRSRASSPTRGRSSASSSPANTPRSTPRPISPIRLASPRNDTDDQGRGNGTGSP